MSHEYGQRPAPGDTICCPECGALGGVMGMIRIRGVMTDKEYNDRRCNACGHLWTVGETLDLPLGGPEKPANGGDVPSKASGPPNYDFGDGWEREVEDVPF